MTTNGKKRNIKKNGKPNPVGRPRVLTPEKKEEILRLIGIGGSREQAAKFVGHDIGTIREEAKRDSEFFNRLTEAEGKAYAGYLTTIGNAAKKGDVKAAQWFLARKYPKEFSEVHRNAQVNAAGEDLTPQQRQKLIDAIIEERKGLAAIEEPGD